MAKKWQRLTDELDMRIDSDGQPIIRLREDDRRAMRAKANLRKHGRGRGLEIADGVRMTASYPVSEKIRMEEQYGTDPEAEAAFLRDNPQHCLSKDVPGAHPKRTYIFLSGPNKGAR